jgi:enamine deaminase RidA (YjgF/YER057c/UK114 family)
VPNPTEAPLNSEDRQTPEERLLALGFELPAPITPVASYVGCTRTDDLIFVSGHGPFADGAVAYRGRVSAGDDLAYARDGAQLTILNVLSTLRAELGSLERITRVLKLLVLVSSAPDFFEQHLVANGASDLLVAAFGADRGAHARSAVGMASLPLDMTVEIEGVFSYTASP